MNLPVEIQNVISTFPKTKDLAADVDLVLCAFGREITRQHVPRVTRLGEKLALKFGVDPQAVRTAALLHDIGGIFQRDNMVRLCETLGLPIEQEERRVPLLLHAKLSVVLAREWQRVNSLDVLQAIRYHTTLHGEATALDQVVFLADKLEWDQGGRPPYLADLSAALDESLEDGTRWMLRWMSLPEAKLLIPHPDLLEAWRRYNIPH